jgi:DNA replication protein DnaD
MKKTTKNVLMGSLVSAGSAAIATAIYKKRKKANFPVDEDIDTKHDLRADWEESPNADYEEEEIGLTKLDSTYRQEWQANGFPMTHAEMERLEKEAEQDYENR